MPIVFNPMMIQLPAGCGGETKRNCSAVLTRRKALSCPLLTMKSQGSGQISDRTQKWPSYGSNWIHSRESMERRMKKCAKGQRNPYLVWRGMFPSAFRICIHWILPLMWSNHAVVVSDFLRRPIFRESNFLFQDHNTNDLCHSSSRKFTGQDAPSCDIEWEELWCCVWARKRAVELLDISPSSFEVSNFFVQKLRFQNKARGGK